MKPFIYLLKNPTEKQNSADCWKGGSRGTGGGVGGRGGRGGGDGGDGVCQFMNKLLTILFLGLPQVQQFCRLPSGGIT